MAPRRRPRPSHPPVVPNRAFTAGKRPAGRHDSMCVVASSPSVAMIGGGQLARMTHQSAIALGRTLRAGRWAKTRSSSTGHFSPSPKYGAWPQVRRTTPRPAARRCARGQLAFGVHLLYGGLTDLGVQRSLGPVAQIGQLARGRCGCRSCARQRVRRCARKRSQWVSMLSGRGGSVTGARSCSTFDDLAPTCNHGSFAVL